MLNEINPGESAERRCSPLSEADPPLADDLSGGAAVTEILMALAGFLMSTLAVVWPVHGL